MRTAIFLGFMMVADAIRKDWLVDDAVIKFIAIVFIIIAIMDVTEFTTKIIQPRNN